MLRTRVLSSIIGVPIVAGCIIAGGIWLKGFFLILGAVGLFEFFRMMKSKGQTPFIIPSYMLFLCLTCGAYLYEYYLPAVFMVILLYMAGLVSKYREEKLLDMVFSIFGACYLGLGFHFAILISDMAGYLGYIALAFILTWSSDIGGYAVGIRFGKHKMTPILSPSKSWEGAAGCIMFTAAAAAGVAYITHSPFLWYWLLLGIVASVAAQLGDLLESSLKRYFEVKDSGRLIPGHGGVLDRFDSFIFVLPIVYYLQHLLHGAVLI